MRKYLITVLILLFFCVHPGISRERNNSILYNAIDYRGLTPEDISIPLNLNDTSARNNNRLLLPIVKEMMLEPLRYEEFLDKSLGVIDYEFLELFNYFFELIGYYDSSKRVNRHITAYSNNVTIKTVAETIFRSINAEKEDPERIVSKLSNGERKFLKGNILSIISEDNFTLPGYTADVFKYNIVRDSSIAISKYTMDLLSRIADKNYIYSRAFKTFLFNYLPLYSLCIKNAERYKREEGEYENTEELKGYILEYINEDGVKIAIGGEGDNIYTGDFDCIIDFGGNDVYNMENGDIMDGSSTCIIDLSGNDKYESKGGFALAGSVFSTSLILDKSGDDTYRSGNISLGSAICGFGLLYDESGNDIYYSNSFSLGAAAFGVGLLIDSDGNDIYSASTYSQGFGMTEGIGAIIDKKGNDSYLINSLSVDLGRYEDHYVSMCQGYGLGLRPYYAGGVGLIIEGGGNDIYNTDIFGQGGAYWYGLGAIADKSGHDKYNSYQYGQGSGIHLAVGFLKDYDGWDFYSSNGVSQGCGHDYGIGILHDVKGNDNYSAYSLSQGAGNANGIGILLDESGRDGYLSKEPGNTRGYGNPRRDYGSIGLFTDVSGQDYYSVPGLDSTLVNKSMWGTGLDYYYTDESAQQNSKDFKVELSTAEDYSIEQYFVMGKTIEPRFSKWQQYGTEKLIEDSMKTAEYMLTRLSTNDHRETFLMRNLIRKIPYAVSSVFINKLGEYQKDNSILNQGELSLMAYLLGETGRPLGKEALLELTYSRNLSVRSAALIALGKAKYDTSDVTFISDVSARLREMAGENSDSKIYNKNIAYAFKNYKETANIETLVELLHNGFFGVRFLSAEALQKYGNEYFSATGSNNITEIINHKTALISYIYSIQNLGEENYKFVVETIAEKTSDETVIYNLIYSVKAKREASNDPVFTEWASEKLELLSINLSLKIE